MARIKYGVGEVRTKATVAYHKGNGVFGTVSNCQDVKGIYYSVVDAIKAYLTIAG